MPRRAVLGPCLLAPLLAPLALAALVAGCGSGGEGDPRPVLADLVDRFDLADARRETRVVPLGAPAAHPHQERGWSVDERHGADDLVWSDGPESVLEFEVVEPRPLELRVRGRAFAFEGAPPQRVAVDVGDRPVGTLTFTREMAFHGLAIPANALRPGTNRLRFRYAWARAPADVLPDSADVRELAVLFDEVHFDDGRAPETAAAALALPRRESAPPALVVPSGARLDYTVALAPDAVLRVDALALQPADGTRAELWLERSGAGPVPLARFGRAPRGPAEVPVPGRAGEVARLSIRSVGGAPGDAARWVRPRLLSAAAPAAAPRHPDVVLYLIDTLRRDQLGAHGGPAGLTPNLDRLAGRSLVFERAVAQSSWTRSSMGSIFTGRWPQHHGANDTADRLAERLVTLAEVLLAHGYETAGFTANPLVDHTFGFDQGFTTFASITGEQSFLARSEELQRQALDWLDRRRDPDRPFFLYLHTMDPHEPYDPPADFRARWALPGTPAEVGRVDWLARLRRGDVAPTPAVRDQVRAVYAAEVAANDARLGDWIEALRARGRFDGAIWIVASDHGEAFAEHGHFGHRYGLNEELLRVPLLWKAPEGERGGERSPAVARHVDILPTLLDALGLPPPGTLDGRSLAAADTDSTDPASVAFLETGPVRWTSVTDGRWKLIRSRRRGGPDRVELFDLTRDPDERNDLSTQETGKVEALLATLDASEPEVAPPATGEVEIDPALRTRLEALGYAD